MATEMESRRSTPIRKLPKSSARRESWSPSTALTRWPSGRPGGWSATNSTARRRCENQQAYRLAFVWAEQDRTALSKCWPEGSPQRKEAEEQAAALRSYRAWPMGRTLGDKLDDVSRAR